jgi:FkbM family methyltransferase
MMHGDIGITLKTENGWAILPSSLKRSDGTPRFNLSFPAFFAEDVGAKYLVFHEIGAGYELPTRNFIERTLRRGDLFVDVGAHWGFFTLQAATHADGGIDVVSFEPELLNATILTENVVRNNVTKAVTVVGAACGNEYELAPLATNSTMGHSIRGVNLPEDSRGPPKWVVVVPLDKALASLPGAAGRRIVIKIDAEGFEPNIIAGASSLLRSGRVAAVIWECGLAAGREPGRRAVIEMVAALSDCGFRHLRPQGHEVDGPLIDFDAKEAGYIGNVFSLGPLLATA